MTKDTRKIETLDLRWTQRSLRQRDALFGGRTNSIRKLMRLPVKKSSTSMCVHSTQLFASTDGFHFDILPSVLKRTLIKTIADSTMD